MNDEKYIEIEVGDESYVVVPEGEFAGDPSKEDIRVLDSDDLTDFEMGADHTGTVVGIDPSEYDSVDQMYRDAVERAQELNSDSVEDEFFSEDPLEEEPDDELEEDPLEALDMYGGE
jgi:hypothetical protein